MRDHFIARSSKHVNKTRNQTKREEEKTKRSEK